MMKPLLTSAILVALLMSGLAEAGTAFLDGNRLLEYCAAPRGTLQFGFCAGHIAGVADAMTSYGGLGEYRACIPDRVQVGQAVEVVIQNLRVNPSKRHLTASSLTAEALTEAFPCR
jgi:hypothetical protein